MLKVLRFLLTVFVWLVILALCVAGAILLEYEMQEGAMLFGILFATWYGIKLTIYLYKRWQAKSRVQKLINLDAAEESRKQFSLFEVFSSRDIDKHLKRVIHRISRSDINRHGDPTATMKWSMHVKFDDRHGDWLHAGSVNRPKIQDPVFDEYDHISWQIFNEFMMLDVAAYLMQDNNPTAKSQWLELLNGLSYSKKRSSLDGLVISLHVEQLNDEAQRVLLANRIRLIYENIKEYCGVEVPISLVLLGLDDLKGVDAWVNGLEDDLLQQVLGKVNQQGAQASQVVDACFDGLQDVFRQGSLVYLMANGYNAHAASLTTRANQLRDALTHVVNRTFNASQFQDSPAFAGLFFVMEPNKKPIFVDDLLAGSALVWKLPASTRLTTVSDKAKQRNYAGYFAVSGLLTLLLFLIHSNNQAHIETSVAAYRASLSTGDGVSQLVNNLQGRYVYTNALQEVRLAHWLPGTSDPLGVYYNRARFMKDLDDLLITPIEARFSAALESDELKDLDSRVDYLSILVRRINLLKAVNSGASMKSLSELPQPYDKTYIDSLPETMLDELNLLVLHGFELGRQDDTGRYRSLWLKRQEDYQRQLSSLLLSSNGTMDWLVTWVGQSKIGADVTMNDYWQGNAPTIGGNAEVRVGKAYTIAGKEQIDAFIDQLGEALGRDHVFVTSYVPRFQAQYEKNYIASWGAFLSGFNDGVGTLRDRNEWLNVINNLATGRNIFFNLLNDVDFQLQPFAGVEEKPDWFEFVLYYQDMLALGEDDLQNNDKKNKVLTKIALKLVGSTGALGKALAGSAKSGLKTQKKLDKAAGAGPGPTERELNLDAAAKELDAYKTALAAIVFNIERRSSSYDSIRGEFENAENPSSAGTVLANAQLSIQKLQALIGKVGMSTRPFWDIYMGPVLLSEKFMLQETACHIDQLWEDDFLFELAGVPDYKLNAFAYAENGLLWQFTDDKLGLFLKKRMNAGYNFKRVNGETVPLRVSLLDFLVRAKDSNKSQKYKTFDLDIKAMPTNLNKKALLYVSATELSMQCESDTQTLMNKNFDVEQKFNWEPSCGTISLKFTIGNKIIEKRYGGPTGVEQFLLDFNDGQHTFDVEEFPEYFYLLKQFEISRIEVNYEIDGGARLLEALSQRPPKAPASIAACWE